VRCRIRRKQLEIVAWELHIEAVRHRVVKAQQGLDLESAAIGQQLVKEAAIRVFGRRGCGRRLTLRRIRREGRIVGSWRSWRRRLRLARITPCRVWIAIAALIGRSPDRRISTRAGSRTSLPRSHRRAQVLRVRESAKSPRARMTKTLTKRTALRPR
ncbi:MAG: hypothetical protein KDJ43_12525, partial [Rhizobiaceae bacterium]|nr:hypothetical protein [Rhizobiaceae bacterium]